MKLKGISLVTGMLPIVIILLVSIVIIFLVFGSVLEEFGIPVVDFFYGTTDAAIGFFG